MGNDNSTQNPTQEGPKFGLDVLASGFSAVLGVDVVIADSTQRKDAGLDLLPTMTVDDVFNVTYTPVPDELKASNSFAIFVKTLTGSTIFLQITDQYTIASVKAEIQIQEDIPATKQRLSFNGKKLDDDETVKSAGIPPWGTVFLVLNLRGSGKPKVVMPKEHLAEEFNYDFSEEHDDGTQYFRGGYEYHRPYGWYRFALKVHGDPKYGGDDSWLGPKGIRTDGVKGEWPVSYHGTKDSSKGSIIKEGFKAGPREVHGKGVYSTPSLAVAEDYAAEYTHKGHQYKVIFQNRVNPEGDRLTIIKAKGTRHAGTPNGDYWISHKQDPAKKVYDIRPYGVLIRCMD